jgi:TIR domain
LALRITIGTITRFLGLSTTVLDKTQKLIRTAAEFERSLELLPGAGSGGEHPGCEAARRSNEPAGRRDFFVSFNQADRLWATWIAWVLEEAGYSVFFQDWDFRGNFIEHMNRAHSHAHRTLAVLSDRYFGSDFALAEWSARFAQDPASREDRLVPVKVGPLTGENILGPIVYADLIDCPEEVAQERLLGRVRKAVDASYRNKPQSRPGFPGGSSREFPIKPIFPERGSKSAANSDEARSRVPVNSSPSVSGARPSRTS